MTVDMTQSILSKLKNTHDLFHVVVGAIGIIFILIRHVLIREAGTFLFSFSVRMELSVIICSACNSVRTTGMLHAEILL
jgi:hypothetical protein